jgi:hypothetical protein
MSTRLSTNVPQAVSRQRVSKLEQQPTAIPHNWHEMSLDMLWPRFNEPRARPTPGVTVEAIKQAVRDRGLCALDEPQTRERLQRCDDRAILEIDQWLLKREISR